MESMVWRSNCFRQRYFPAVRVAGFIRCTVYSSRWSHDNHRFFYRDLRSPNAENSPSKKRISIEASNNNHEMTLKINRMKEFAKSLRERSSHLDQLNLGDKCRKSIGLKAEQLELTQDRSQHQLTYSPMDRILSEMLPHDIRIAINDDTLIKKCLLVKRNKNWDRIILRLYESEAQLTNISMRSIKLLMYKVKNNLSLDTICLLDNMLLSKLGNDPKRMKTYMYEFLFEALANAKKLEDKRALSFLNSLLSRNQTPLENYECKGIQPIVLLTPYCLSSCIKLCTKMKDSRTFKNIMDLFIKIYKVELNKKNYDHIIQFYSHIGQNKNAWDAFDTMKFLSLKHQPTNESYNLVIELCAKELNFPKALDLFEEMEGKGLVPDVGTLTIMAKLLAKCSADSYTSENKSESLRLLGWRFINRINDSMPHELEKNPNVHMAMMALACYDGDLSLARALYYKYIRRIYKNNLVDGSFSTQRDLWQKTLSPQLFNYLLFAYARNDINRISILSTSDEGNRLRNNLINSADYTGTSDDDLKSPLLPMLPFKELSSDLEIFSESNALWNFHLDCNGTIEPISLSSKNDLSRKVIELSNFYNDFQDFKFNTLIEIAKTKVKFVNHVVLNPITLSSYLLISLRKKNGAEFLRRLKQFTYEQHTLDENLLKIYEQKQKRVSTTTQSHSFDTSIEQSHTDELKDCQFLVDLVHKVPLNSALYEVAMKGAIVLQDYEMAKNIWQSKGKYRKTSAFANLSLKERIESDRKFACLMVDFNVTRKKYDEAIAIILASKNYINWDYQMVRNLHHGLLEIEDTKHIRILLDVVNRKKNHHILKQLDEEIAHNTLKI